MKVALIPCGMTDWRAAGRLLGRAELDLAPAAEGQCAAWGEQLRSAGLGKVFHSPDGLSKATAQHIARRLNVPAKVLSGLREVDLGLWSGLTEEQLKARFPKAHRQLVDSPLNVVPPEGEDFAEAAKRMRACFKKRIKPNGKVGIGLVMRPLAFAMARWVLEGVQSTKLWDLSQNDNEPVIIDCHEVPEPLASTQETPEFA